MTNNPDIVEGLLAHAWNEVREYRRKCKLEGYEPYAIEAGELAQVKAADEITRLRAERDELQALYKNTTGVSLGRILMEAAQQSTIDELWAKVGRLERELFKWQVMAGYDPAKESLREVSERLNQKDTNHD